MKSEQVEVLGHNLVTSFAITEFGISFRNDNPLAQNKYSLEQIPVGTMGFKCIGLPCTHVCKRPSTALAQWI